MDRFQNKRAETNVDFPRIWPSLAWIFAYFILQIVFTVVATIIAAMLDPTLLAALRNPAGFDQSLLAGPLIWGILATAALMSLMLIRSIRKRDPADSLGLTRDNRVPLDETIKIAVVLLIGVYLFNYVYTTYIFPGVEMQDGIEDLIRSFLASPGGILVGFLTVAVAVPIAEELLFRGFLQNALAKHVPPLVAIAIAAALFSVVHLQPYAVPPLFLMGFAFGYIYWKTGSLRTNIALHMLNNGAAILATILTAPAS